MITKKNNIAIIPARSGSKGLIDKNIKLLNGKPLLSYSIQAAIESKIFDEVFLSTDSLLYANIAKEYGASVPFIRDSKLATDLIPSWDVVRDILNHYQQLDITFETVTLLQPTSPLRTTEDILNGYQLLKNKNAKSIVSVCETEHSPLWCFTIPTDGCLYEYGQQEMVNLSRQQLPKYYRENGALYIVKTEYLLQTDSIYDKDCYAYIMPKERSVDIDDNYDFALAELGMTYNSDDIH